MKSIIIAFKSRNSIHSFSKLLKTNGVYSSIINTPHSISSSCGLSLKTEYKNFNVITSLISQLRTSDLIGIYMIEKNEFGEILRRLG
ncbi:MAG: DUF3343 domain-containing protein [Clostridiales bacterium]|nr:DUF3343 domain-containing protein [Clostridiales bacterium]